MGTKKLSESVYVFIDVSNIRTSCLRSCNFKIDFKKFLSYLRNKYPNLEEVRYYEGIAKDDRAKRLEFNKLGRLGYTMRPMSRKTYVDEAIMRRFKCRECGHFNQVKIMPKSKKMKSNVDVFLATEMLEIAHFAKRPTHIILVSCDGDYKEAILSAARNPKVKITVLATPPVKDREKNTLSIRLKELRKELPNQYQLVNIESIKDYIVAK